MERDTLFKEQQGFSQGWLRFLVPAFLSLAVIVCIIQYYTKEESLQDAVMAIALIALVTVFIFSIRMETRIKADGIYVRFAPFHRKHQFYSWEQIHAAYVREYNPLLEYGGWGMRLGLFGRGSALNVSGNTGIQLVFKNGTKLLIGTRQPQEAIAALKRL